MKLFGFDCEKYIKNIFNSITSKSNNDVDATVEVFQSLSNKALRNQDLAIGRMRQLENKASWLIPSFLIIFNIEYNKYGESMFGKPLFVILVLSAIISLVPLICIIFPKMVNVSDDYEQIVKDANCNHTKSSSRNNFINIEKTSIEYTNETTDNWNKQSGRYRYMFMTSTVLLVLHWCIILGAVLNKG